MNQLFLPFVIITALHVFIAPRHSYIGISYIEVHCIVSDAQNASNSLVNMAIYKSVSTDLLIEPPPHVAGETAAAVLYSFISLGPDFLDNGSWPSPNRSPRNLNTKLGRSQG